MGDAVNAVPRGMLIAFDAFSRKEEKSEDHNLFFNLMKLEKEEQAKPKSSRKKNNNEN